MRELAGAGPVLLAVDDAQWLDAPTASVLTFAVRRLEREPVGVVCAFRPHAAGLGLLDSVERHRVRRVRVGPLALVPLGRIIAERLGRPLPRPVLARIADASRGNPFYALEVARLVPRDAATSDAGLPVPDDVRTLAATRVHALPKATQRALLRAAVLAEPDTRAVDAQPLAPAEDRGIVRVDERGRIEFSHPLFAAAISASASAAQRRAAHRAAAAHVGDPEQRARHLAYSADRADRAVAAELDLAAELAASRGAPDAAAELVELALERTPARDGALRAQRLLRAAGLHLDAGGAGRASELLAQLLLAATSDRVRAHALRLRATLESRSDGFSTAIQTTLEALAAAAGEPSLAAAIELDAAFYLVGLGDVGGGLRHAEAAVGRADLPGGDQGVLGDALAVAAMVAFLNGDGLSSDRLERALALEEPDRRRLSFTAPRLIAGLLLMWTGRLREAVQTLVALRAERMERGVESEISTFSLYLVWAYLWLGETEHAAEIAAADAAAVALLGDPGMTALTRSAEALVSAQRGDIEATRIQANAALAAVLRARVVDGHRLPALGAGVRRAVGTAIRPPRTPCWSRSPRCSRRSASPTPSGSCSCPTRSRRSSRWASWDALSRSSSCCAGWARRTTVRGRSPPPRAAAASWPRRRATSMRPPPRCARRSSPTTASRCRSSAPGRCWPSGGRCGGASSGRRRVRRCARPCRCSRSRELPCGRRPRAASWGGPASAPPTPASSPPPSDGSPSWPRRA